MMTRIASALALALAVAACGGTARGLEAYRTDTAKLLDDHSAQIKQCYDDALKGDAKLAGTITVHFTVEKKTGTITNATVEPASGPLGQCVVKTVSGLQLTPPDKNEGHATFVYEFKPAA
ncbi:MAG TPA: AgmX/PglI C-terminal domain-containing protein [Kofleriaceae bacterium]|nr:AgmX/PglI C-terminal domain-containing protein [Kofleriaceae bacterium]